MSVHQVEEFYIHTTGEKLSEKTKHDIKQLFSDEDYSDYEFHFGGQITVNDIESEHEALELEEKIYAIIKAQ